MGCFDSSRVFSTRSINSIFDLTLRQSTYKTCIIIDDEQKRQSPDIGPKGYFRQILDQKQISKYFPGPKPPGLGH